MKRTHKRPFLILEVLIAFCLVAFCAIPLIYPHISMIKSQNEFVNKIKMNQAIHLIYVDILEKLHKNEIPLSDIENKKLFQIEPQNLKNCHGYVGSYQFIKEKHKKRNSDGITVHLATLQLKLVPKRAGKTYTYDYDIFFGSKKDPLIEDKEAEDDEED